MPINLHKAYWIKYSIFSIIEYKASVVLRAIDSRQTDFKVYDVIY